MATNTKKTVFDYTLTDNFSKGLRAFAAGTSKVTEELAKLNQVTELVGKGFDALSSGFGLGPALEEAGEFEDILARVQVKTAASAEELTALGAAAQDAVGTTRFSLEEAEQGLSTLADSGLSATQATEQLGVVLGFAQANALGAAEAAGGLADTLDAFGESADQIGHIADSLTAVATAAGTTGKQLQDGLLAAGVAAEQANVSIELTAAALGALASAGIEGGKAGQRLTQLLQQLGDPASKAGEALKALGLDASDFAGVIQRLGTDSAAAEQVLAALGNRPRAALKALLTDGGGSLQAFTSIIDDSAGASQRAAEALNKTFAGSLAQVVNAFEAAKTTFLQPLLPKLAAELQALADDIAAFTETAKFDQLRTAFSDFVIEGVKGLKEFAAGFDFSGAADKLQSFVSTASTVLGGLAKTIGVVSDVIEVFGAGVKAPFNLLDAAWEGSKGVALAAGQAIVGTVRLVASENEALANTSQMLGDKASESFDKAGQAAEDFGGNIKTFLVGPTNEATEATRKLNEQQGQLKAVLESIATTGEGYLDALRRAGLQLAESVGVGGKQIEQIGAALKGISEEAKLAALNARAEFLVIGQAADSTGDQIAEAFRNAIQSANSKAELDSLQVEFNKLGLAGKLTWEQLAAGSEALGFKLRDLAQAAIPALEDQFKILGVTSQHALDEAALAASKAFDEIVKGARDGVAATADIERAFTAFAQKQLAAADGADEFKRRQVEAMLITKAETLGVAGALQELGLAGEEATAKLATGADRATEALGGTRDVVEETADAAQDLGVASASTAGNITQVASAADGATGSVSGLSRAYQDAAAQAVGFGLSQDGLREQVNQQTEEYERYRQKLLDVIKQHDPLEQAITRLTRQFPSMTAAGIRTLAELEQRAEQAAARIDEVAKRTSASSSYGGGNAQGSAAGNPQGRAAGNPQGNAGGSYGQAAVPNITMNFNGGAKYTPAEAEEIVRAILPPLRRAVAAGAVLLPRR